MALSAANYGEAIKILKKGFGNRQLIITKHMESLLAVNAVTSDQHLRDLGRLYDQSEANIRSLKALGVEPESYGAMLSSVLLSKLPPELRLIVSRKVAADVLETFEQELRAGTTNSAVANRINVFSLPLPSLPLHQDNQIVHSVSNPILQSVVPQRLMWPLVRNSAKQRSVL